MCYSPYVRDNPNYGRKSITKDTISQRLSIPCGYCPQCIAVKQMRLVQRVEMEAEKNHLFLATLTYDPEHLPIYAFFRPDKPDEAIRVPYFDYKHVVNMHKRMKHDNCFGKSWRFFAVSELGSLRGRPHAHILYMFPKSEFSTPFRLSELQAFEHDHYFDVFNHWQLNKGTDKHPVYENLCRYVVKRDPVHPRGYSSTYDFHYVYPSKTPNGVSDVAFYVLKYMLKPSPRAVNLQRAIRMNHSEEIYRESWSVIKPRYFKSLGFGLNAKANPRSGEPYLVDSDITRYLHDGVRSALENKERFPCFYSPTSGRKFPLAPFYRNNSNIVTAQNQFDFWLMGDPDSFSKTQLLYDINFRDQDEKSKKLFRDFVRHNQQADQNSYDEFFNNLFN